MAEGISDDAEVIKKSRRVISPVDYKSLNSVGRKEHDEEPFKEPSEKKQASESLDKRLEHGDETEKALSAREEKERLKRTLRELDVKADALRQQQELEFLRKEVDERRQAVLDLETSLSKAPGKVSDRKGKSDGMKLGGSGLSKGAKKTSKESEGGMSLTIDSLRQMDRLKSKVNKELSKLGLSNVDPDSSSSDSIDSSNSSSSVDSDSDDAVSNAFKLYSSDISKKQKKKAKSGIDAKVSDTVVNKQSYPQAHLRFDFVSQGISFNKLELNLFVAGELEIISACSNKKEKKGRLELLKKLMYLVSSFDFHVIRALYAAVLREIELGRLKWGDDFHYVESAVLARYKPKVRNSFTLGEGKNKFQAQQEGGGEALWFCAKYQRNKCPHKSAHTVVLKGKMRYAKHICATCWQLDHKQLNHPECSSSCPHASD